MSGWALAFDSKNVGNFLEISKFPKIPRLTSFGNSYIHFLVIIILFRFTCGKGELFKNLKKSTVFCPILWFSHKISKTTNQWNCKKLSNPLMKLEWLHRSKYVRGIWKSYLRMVYFIYFPISVSFFLSAFL